MAEGLVLNEQRSLTRRELIYYLKVIDRATKRELGRMGDIHVEGLLILSEKPLKVGQVYEVTMELPKALWAEGHREIDLRFEAVWTRFGPKNSTYHENGVKFINLSADRKAVIDRLIDLFAMPTAT